MHLLLYWIFIQLSLLLSHLNGYNSHFVQTDRRAVHYLKAQGEGELPPLVLLHGIGCQSTDLYPLMIHMRKFSRKVIAVDLPAHGQTAIPVEALDLHAIRAAFNRGLDQILAHEEAVLLFGNSFYLQPLSGGSDGPQLSALMRFFQLPRVGFISHRAEVQKTCPGP